MGDDVLIVDQNTNRSIVISGIKDKANNYLDVTGWSVWAQVRPTPEDSVILAEWVSGTPTGLQGQAAAVGDVGTVYITPAMSNGWSWKSGVIQIYIDEPVAPYRRERIGDALIVVNPSAVR